MFGELGVVVKTVLADLGEIGEKAIAFLENPNTEAEIGDLIKDAGIALAGFETVEASGVTGVAPTALALLKYVMSQPTVKATDVTSAEDPAAPDADVKSDTQAS